MFRLASIIAITVSLLIWSAQAFCDTSQSILEKTVAAAAEKTVAAAGKTVAAVKAVPAKMSAQPAPQQGGFPQGFPQGGFPQSGPQQSGLAGGIEAFFRPARYKPVAPQMAGYASPPGHSAPGFSVPPDIYPPDSDPSDAPVIVRERIVYVPYSSPPPIYIERLGKALPRPPVMKWMLGDAYMYEYPEMPLRMYTTRGPRDFLAPNPPSIGY